MPPQVRDAVADPRHQPVTLGGARVHDVALIAGGVKSGRHSHPGLVMAYVADGEFWYVVDGQRERVYRVGEAFPLPHSAIHNEGPPAAQP